MTAWRQESWVALQRGEQVDPRWSAYSDYARLRGEGLREQALQAASRCAADLDEGDEATRWDFTSWLCREVLSARTTRSMVLPHPLEAVVLKALWRARAEGRGDATRWLVRWFPDEVMASRDYATDALGDVLREGLTSSPADEALQGALADHLLAWVRTDVADLAHDRYDGDPEADLARLAEADSLVSPSDSRRVQIADLRQLIAEWKARAGSQ